MRIEKINNRLICIGGIGKMFYQDGFPISMAISELKAKGIEVSIMHIADECMKHGWSAKTTFNKLKSDIEDDIIGHNIELQLIEAFCYADYDTQRTMIFDYLFTDKETSKKWLFGIIEKIS